jgi:hypothetical protein
MTSVTNFAPATVVTEVVSVDECVQDRGESIPEVADGPGVVAVLQRVTMS